jgi:hypothetical protein
VGGGGRGNDEVPGVAGAGEHFVARGRAAFRKGGRAEEVGVFAIGPMAVSQGYFWGEGGEGVSGMSSTYHLESSTKNSLPSFCANP